MIMHDNYYFPDDIGDKYDYFLRHMRDGKESFPYLGGNFSLAVQAGGHVGLWPIFLSKHFARVITFEPEPKNQECLCENIGIHDTESRIEAHGAALSSADGTMSLVQSPVNTGGHYLGHNKKDNEVEVELRSIDNLDLNECSAIYLDIEGHELEALRGAEETINEHSPLLMLEVKDHVEKGGCTQKELEEYLSYLGYLKVGEKAHDSIYVRA